MTPEDDRLLSVLGELGADDPDPARSREIIGRATRTIARQRRFARNRVLVTAAVYGAIIAPFAAGTLSAGYIAVAIVQAVLVLRVTQAGIF